MTPVCLPPSGCWSLPPRGAWIEIVISRSKMLIPLGRSPHGERGLKWRLSWVSRSFFGSLPPRGAWIEIADIRSIPPYAARRSPHGERGLKCLLTDIRDFGLRSLPPRGAWIEITTGLSGWTLIQVAPPTGSVD